MQIHKTAVNPNAPIRRAALYIPKSKQLHHAIARYHTSTYLLASMTRFRCHKQIGGAKDTVSNSRLNLVHYRL